MAGELGLLRAADAPDPRAQVGGDEVAGLARRLREVRAGAGAVRKDARVGAAQPRQTLRAAGGADGAAVVRADAAVAGGTGGVVARLAAQPAGPALVLVEPA